MKMKRSPIQLAMLLAGLLGGGAGAFAADTTSTSTAPAGAVVTTTAGGTGGTASSAGASTTTSTTTAPTTSTTTTLPVSSQYVDRITARYGSLLGSTANTQSLVAGLRNGTPITLQAGNATTVPGTTTGAGTGSTAGTTTAGAVTFTSPAGRMGYGNVTRTLDLAARQLAAAGITQPTPQQLQAALMGGSVTNGADQATTMQGVLDLRSQGMGWGKIAHTIGVHPGMGKMPASATAGTGRSGIVTADGLAARGHHRHGEEYEARHERHEEYDSRVRHSYASHGSIVTAGGTTMMRGGERGEHHHSSHASRTIGPVATASGAGAAGGIVTANGGGFGGGKQEGEHGKGHK